MKHTSRILMLCGLSAAAMATGCSDGGKSAGNIAFEHITGRAAYRLEGSAEDYGRPSDLAYFDSASIIMPREVYGHDISELRDSIVKAAFDTIAAPRVAMRAYFGSCAAETGYHPAEIAATDSVEGVAEGTVYVYGNLAALSGEWMTYCVTTASYMPGAAHGMTVNRYFTYAMVPGRLVSLDRLFTPEGLKALPAIISNQASRMEDVIGPTSITALPANDNFLINSDGSIVFAYQPYEVASYAQGEIRIPFYPYQLSEYMTPEALEMFHLNMN